MPTSGIDFPDEDIETVPPKYCFFSPKILSSPYFHNPLVLVITGKSFIFSTIWKGDEK
jgi:hypothetical protein